MSFNLDNWVFSNSNNVSFNLGSASVVTVSHNLAGTGTAVTGGASITLNSTGLSFNGTALAGTNTSVTGLATVNMNSAGLSFNGSGLCGTNTATSGGGFAWTVNSSGISFNGSNIAGTSVNVTGTARITLNTKGLSFDGSALAGNGTGTAVSGGAAVTLSANTVGVSLSFNGNSLAGTGYTTGTTTGAWTATNSTNGLSEVMPFLTRWAVLAEDQLVAVTAPGNASISFRYVHQKAYLTATRVDALIGMSFSTTAGAGTQTLQQSAYCVIYTKNASSLSSLSSGSTQTTWTMASNTAGQTQLSQAAIRLVSVPVNINMQPGEYYVAFNYVTAATAVSMTHSIYGGSLIQTASNFADMASTTNATTNPMFPGMGLYAAASTGIPASVSISSINQTGANLSAANIALVFRNA